MSMESLSLLPRLLELPKANDVDGLDTVQSIACIRAMDRSHFAIEVSQATEEALTALFQARNVPDVLNEGYGLSFSSVAEQGITLHDRYGEMLERGSRSVTGFVSNLKGKVAELRVESALEERYPGYDFRLAKDPTQEGWDLSGASPDGQDILVQVKAGAESYTDETLDFMEEYPNYPFAVSSEIYAKVQESYPELAERLIDIGPAKELTEEVRDGLEKLAGNMGLDVPDSLSGVLPIAGEVVLGIRLIWDVVRTERELRGVGLTDRSRLHGVRALALMSRFGINQVCIWAGGAGGTAAGSMMPGAGNVVGGLAGSAAGLGGAFLLNRMLQPRIEEVAIKLVGGDADDMFYLMNKPEIDQLGQSFAATLLPDS